MAEDKLQNRRNYWLRRIAAAQDTKLIVEALGELAQLNLLYSEAIDRAIRKLNVSL
jgi:hypothetical protein